MKKLPIYIAGIGLEMVRVRKWADALERSDSVRITHRWFDAEPPAREHEIAPEALTSRGEIALAAVREARLFWLLMPAGLNGDSMIEYGFAIGHQRRSGTKLRIIVSGANLRHTNFAGLAHETHELDVHAFQSILKHATRRLSGVG